jgi:hypothetical protein
MKEGYSTTIAFKVSAKPHVPFLFRTPLVSPSLYRSTNSPFFLLNPESLCYNIFFQLLNINPSSTLSLRNSFLIKQRLFGSRGVTSGADLRKETTATSVLLILFSLIIQTFDPYLSLTVTWVVGNYLFFMEPEVSLPCPE